MILSPYILLVRFFRRRSSVLTTPPPLHSLNKPGRRPPVTKSALLKFLPGLLALPLLLLALHFLRPGFLSSVLIPSTTSHLSPTVRQSNPPNLVIHFAANTRASLWVDGVRVSDVTDWAIHKTFRGQYRRGTIIALQVDNTRGWGGVVAQIRYRKSIFVTGGHPGFKAHAKFESRANNRAARKVPQASCRWNKVIPVQVLQRHVRRSLTFPFLNGAQYVWAKDAPRIGSVIVRFVLGGETCLNNPPSPSPTPFISSTCTCRPINALLPTDCFSFVGSGKEDMHGLRNCRKSNCDTLYECAQRGTTTCETKMYTGEVRMIRRVQPRRFRCLHVTLSEPKVLVVPVNSGT